jgi:hypothetical protein
MNSNYIYIYITKKNEGLVYLEESGFLKITFQTFPCSFVIRKISQWKIFFSQKKNWLNFQESIFLLFWAENTFQKL